MLSSLPRKTPCACTSDDSSLVPLPPRPTSRTGGSRGMPGVSQGGGPWLRGRQHLFGLVLAEHMPPLAEGATVQWAGSIGPARPAAEVSICVHRVGQLYGRERG